MTAFIVPRNTKGGRRFHVRYRLGGRTFKAKHAGVFGTQREARLRRDVLNVEIAAGRDPAVLLAQLAASPEAPRLTVGQMADRWLATRIDVADSTREKLAWRMGRIRKKWGDRDPATITSGEVAEWVAELSESLSPGTVRHFFVQLRSILDELPENPARSLLVRLPKMTQEVYEPPSADDVAAILLNLPERFRLPTRALEQSGARVGELLALEWRDVDLAKSRFRIRGGKTPAARRWATMPDSIAEAVAASCPLEDREPHRPVFPGLTLSGLQAAMRRACKAAGIAHFHPHDLRHRYASVQIARGVPVTDLAAQLGHARKSMTLDTYSHVLLGETL